MQAWLYYKRLNAIGHVSIACRPWTHLFVRSPYCATQIPSNILAKTAYTLTLTKCPSTTSVAATSSSKTDIKLRLPRRTYPVSNNWTEIFLHQTAPHSAALISSDEPTKIEIYCLKSDESLPCCILVYPALRSMSIAPIAKPGDNGCGSTPQEAR